MHSFALCDLHTQIAKKKKTDCENMETLHGNVCANGE